MHKHFQDAPNASARRPCVLLLDDDHFMLELLTDMLDELGSYDVLAEPHARRALQTLAVRRPDLLICDVSMPDMDGIEFLRAAAAMLYRGQVLLLSGVDAGLRMTAERLARAHGLQVVGAVMKPISLEQLREALAAAGLPGQALPDTESPVL